MVASRHVLRLTGGAAAEGDRMRTQEEDDDGDADMDDDEADDAEEGVHAVGALRSVAHVPIVLSVVRVWYGGRGQ